MSKQEQIDELFIENEKLMDEIDKLKKRCKELNESRENTLESCKLSLQNNKEARQKAEDGAFQIQRICNSLLMIVADRYGEIRVPKNHLKLTQFWEPKTYIEGEDYIFQVEKGEEK